MKNLVIVLMLLSLFSCSSIQVSYDYDKGADFTKYKTYDYTPETKELGGSTAQLIRERLLNSVDQEMTSRGYTKAEGGGDLLIELHIKAEKRTTATAYNTGGYGYYRYGNMGTTTINYDEYTDGTLFVNIVDKGTDKLIWQGRGTKTLDENASPEKRDSNIKYAVKTIFEKYPIKPKK
jgi:hypothetical protein